MSDRQKALEALDRICRKEVYFGRAHDEEIVRAALSQQPDVGEGLVGQMTQCNYHKYGSLADSPRKCMVCGIDEFQGEVAPHLDRILTEAHGRLQKLPRNHEKAALQIASLTEKAVEG